MKLIIRVIALAALVFATSTPGVRAQQTFTVTVENRTDEHPATGTPGAWPEVYAIDGVQGQELTLTRGVTYTFQLQNVNSFHPFYIADDAGGGGAGLWTEGVTNNFATGNDELTFTPPESAPDVLYYECSNHSLMGGQLNIVSVGTATDEAPELPAGLALSQNYPNPFNPATEISFDLPTSGHVSLTVFDASGREVRVLVDATLSAGTHAVSWNGRDARGDAAASGTYIYQLRTEKDVLSRGMTLIR